VERRPIHVLHQGRDVLEDFLIDPLEHVPNPAIAIVEANGEGVIDVATSVLPSAYETPMDVEGGGDHFQVNLTHRNGVPSDP
jgi:hypothetical protein